MIKSHLLVLGVYVLEISLIFLYFLPPHRCMWASKSERPTLSPLFIITHTPAALTESSSSFSLARSRGHSRSHKLYNTISLYGKVQAERKSLSVYTAERRDPFSIFSFFGATCIAQQKGAENARGRVIFGQLITFFIGSTKISDGKNKRRAHTFPRVCCAVALADNFQMQWL